MYNRVLLLTVFNPLEAFPDGPLALNNTGNNVFARAIVSYFAGSGVSIMTRAQAVAALSADSDWCRKNFNVVVTYEACLFSPCYRQDMHDMAGFFRRLGVPVFVIGVGVHVGRKAKVGFVDPFADAVRDFLDSVYASGGEITVRGEFTRAVCEHLGYSDVFVSGCGSVYYNGEGFRIDGGKIERRDFVPILNGYYVNDIHPRVYAEFPRAVFFDQDLYYRAIKYPQSVGRAEMKRLAGRCFAKMYRTLLVGDEAAERLQTWQSVPRWQAAIERCGASFSYGSRMHGNMLALLTGIPVFLQVIDARTEELAEFYKIPNSARIGFDERKDSLYDLYRSLDWTEFNDNYRLILSRFGEWIDSKGLPNRIGRNRDIVDAREPTEDVPEVLLQERRKFMRRLAWVNLPFLFGKRPNGVWR